jgi:anti-sigma B factor antagonist
MVNKSNDKEDLIMTLKITELEKNDKICKMSIDGEMDINTYKKVKDKLNEIIDEESIDIELDFQNLSYIDSTGIGVLIGILKKLNKNEQSLVIKNARENIKRLFNITGLDKIFILQ